ncbi:hypothetical protein [Mesobacillus sp.]|uniref:hypothetical protein n=1 Tax=Mesobacillus sp. TaxID=2675271 RepID=UPI0039EE5F52
MKFNLQLLIAFFGSLFGFILMSYMVQAEHLVAFDRVVIDRVQGLEAEGLTAAMKFLTYIGSLKFIVILTIPIFLFLFYVLKYRLGNPCFPVCCIYYTDFEQVAETVFSSRPSGL